MFEEELAKLPANAPRRPDLLPGLRIKSAVSSANIMVAFFLVFIFGLVSLTVLYADPHERLAIGSTKIIAGNVASVTLSGCNGSGHLINYGFVPPGSIRYVGSLSACSGSKYYKLGPGDGIPIKYLVSDPTVHAVLGTADADRPPDFTLLILPLFALFGLIAVASPLRQILKVRKIFRRGNITKGTVLFVKRRVNSVMSRWPSMMPAEVYINFQLPSGTIAEARTRCSNDWLLGHLAPGAEVHIAVNPRKPDDIVLLDAYIR
jgi:hypothetical protein